MANKILVLGDPGSGKTTAAETLKPSETFIICSDRKGLPFAGWKNNYKTITKPDGKLDLEQSNYYETSSSAIVVSLLKAISERKPEIKIVIVDTVTAIMEDEYMIRAKEKGYEKYTDIALDVFNILIAPDDLREDLTVIITGHLESKEDSDGGIKSSFKVVGGKLIGQNIKPEARFNLVLYTKIVMEDNKPTYYFKTQSDGRDTCRTPKGMFEELYIPNDYSLIIERMKEYYK